LQSQNKPIGTKKMNRLKTTPVNKYKGLTEQEINEALMSFAAVIVIFFVMVLSLGFIALIN
jgi:hypothetical protein